MQNNLERDDLREKKLKTNLGGVQLKCAPMVSKEKVR